MRSAIIHDWMTTQGGAERVLEAIQQEFPSKIFTLVNHLSGFGNVESSWIERLPFAKKRFRHYLPLFPLAIESFDLSKYDLILSSSHSVAKGALTHAQQLHICYCHTPMRYAWDLHHTYLKDHRLHRGFKGLLIQSVLHHLRNWDLLNTSRVDHFIANSKHVARRIRKIYNRDAKVIYPPVRTNFFVPGSLKEDFYLTAGRLVPYKRFDLIIRSFAHLKEKKLLVVGEGPDLKRLKGLAGPNVDFVHGADDDEMRDLMQKARAFLYMGEEDFGITPVEAQACGTPVIAYAKGGCLETIDEQISGLFAFDQTEKGLCEAILQFEKSEERFDPRRIQLHAQKFSEERFHREYSTFVHDKYTEFQSTM